MGRRQQKKKEVSESESDHAEEEEEVPESDEEDFLAEDHQEEDDLHRQNEDVIEILKAQTEEGPDEERMTWLALYSLKKQEMELNEKMFKEINVLKDKYDLLKQPVYADMASAALGKKVNRDLYQPMVSDTLPDPDKVTPAALPDYWLVVFENSGLIQDEQDLQTFSRLSEFECQLLNPESNHLRLTFKFKEETSLFTNTVLTIESQNKLEDKSVHHEVKIKEAVKWKGEKNEQSVFYTLFNPSTQPNEVCDLMAEFHRDFCSSIYFYMRKGDLQALEDMDDEDEDGDEDEEKVAKPAKKVKKQMEKPDCKQQ